MTKQQLLELAKSEGFLAAALSPQEVPTDPGFRAFCEENLCGHYGANYSCPPDCGSPEALRETLLQQSQVLIVQTIWTIDGYADKAAVGHARASHNAAVLRLMEKVRAAGLDGFCAGYNGCPLCSPCKRQENQPCAHPRQRISCLSAYCVDVAALAAHCGMEFAWRNDRLYLFGMLALHKAV